MPLTTEQDERLTLILEGLQAVRGQLYAKARDFVDDQIERHGQYGERMFLSPRQSKWLEDLYREFVGAEPEALNVQDAEHAARRDLKDDRDPRSDTDMENDDEIPF